MSNKGKRGTTPPQETPPVTTPPEVKPPAEPVTPGIPEEDPVIKPEERPGKLSPYDFPPPGKGFFPQLF